MKSSTLFLASALIFVLTTASLPSAAAADIVYDNNGNELLKGVSYLINTPILAYLKGSFTITSELNQNNQTCEADIVYNSLKYFPTTPFTITPIDPNDGVIKLEFPVVIQSAASKNPCGESTIWKLSGREGLTINIVTTGGYFNTTNSCFRIISPPQPSSSYNYLIEYCPSLCGEAPEIFLPIGVYEQGLFPGLSTNVTVMTEVFFEKVSEAVDVI